MRERQTDRQTETETERETVLSLCQYTLASTRDAQLSNTRNPVISVDKAASGEENKLDAAMT